MPGDHELPASCSSISLTCQLLPATVTVTASCVLPLVVPFTVTSRCPALTMKVKLEGPKARIETIAAVPVDTCFWLVRRLATPGVWYPACSVAASWPVTRPPNLATEHA